MYQKKKLDRKIFSGVTKKVGNKEYYGDLDAKLAQLRDLGYNENGIESYRILVSFFSEKSQNSDRYTVTMAKTGGSFRDSASKQGVGQQVYFRNPQKRNSGVGFAVKEATGLVDELQKYALSMLGKENSENILSEGEYKGKKTYDLELKSALAEEMGVTRYHELLKYIAEKVFDTCEQRTTA